MLKWLNRLMQLMGWKDEPPPERGWPGLYDLSEEDKERMRAILADYRTSADMTWDEWREYIREQGLPPPPPLKKRM